MISAIINKNGELNPIRTTFVYLMVIVLFSTVVIILRSNTFLYFIVLFPIIPILLFILINKLEYSLLIYIIISPLIQHYSFVHLSVGDFLITPDMIIHQMILIASINHFLFSYDPEQKRDLTLQDKVLLVFVALSVFSLIAASYFPINHSKRILLYYTGIIQPVTFYFIVIYYLSKVPDLLPRLVLAITLTASTAAMVAYIELKEIGLGIVDLYLSRNIIGFGYHNTNLFGMHAALVFPLYFFILKSDEFKNYKLLLWINFILISVLSILTLNRGTFVVLTVYLILLIRKKENRRIVIGFILTAILGGIYYIDLLVLYVTRFIGSGEQARFLMDQSALYRLEVWRVAIKAILKYPFGMGGVGYNYAWRMFSIEPSMNFFTPHQILFYIAIDYGVPALLSFIVFFIIVFKCSDTLSKTESLLHHNLFNYLKLSFIGYFIHGFLTGGEFSHLSGNIFPTNGYSYILMILLAIVSFQYGKLRKSIQ